MAALALAGQIGEGIAQQSKAKRLNSESRAINGQIPDVDPGVQTHLNDIRLRQQYAEHGQSSMLALKERLALNAGAQTGRNIQRASGTAPGATQQGLLRSQNQTQDALNAAAAQSEQLAPTYLGMQTPLINDVSDRRLSLRTYLRDQAGFQGAQAQQNANSAFTGAVGLAQGFQPTLFGSKSTTAAPTGAQMGAPEAMSSYMDPGLGAEVPGLGNPGGAYQWQTGSNPLFQ